jgi:Uma2 family endonuclease
MVANPKYPSDYSDGRLSEAEYVDFEARSEIKHEYIDGRIYAMTGASRSHNLIAIDTATFFNIALRTQGCFVYGSDMRLKVLLKNKSVHYYYPDLMIVCGEERFSGEKPDTLLNPTVVIEILSPGTERTDRRIKAPQYRQIADVQTYLLIHTDQPYIELYRRQGEGQDWAFTDARGIETLLPIPALNVALPLAEVYRQIVFDPAADGE